MFAKRHCWYCAPRRLANKLAPARMADPGIFPGSQVATPLMRQICAKCPVGQVIEGDRYPAHLQQRVDR